MDTRPIRVGIIGMGGFAGVHHNATLALEQAGVCKLICTCDPDMDDFSERQQKLDFSARDVRTFHDYREMLAQCGHELDVITIPTPIPLHASMHRAAVDRGISVYLEKPPTLDYAELERMLAVEARAKKLTNVGFNFIVEPERQAIKQRICVGEFGKVTRVGVVCLWSRGPEYYHRASWAGRLQLNGRLVLDSCLGNAMAHYVHNVLYWSGVQEPMSWGNVESITAELYRGNDIEGTDTVFVRAAITDGPDVHIGMTHACHDRLTETEWIECEKATIRYTCDGGPKRFTIYWHNGEIEEVIFSVSNWVVENFRAYFRYLRGEVDRPMTRLIDSKPFVVLNDLAYVAAKAITTVPSTETETGIFTDGPHYVSIRDINAIIDRFAATGAFPSEQGVAWAGKPGTATPSDLSQLTDVVKQMIAVRAADWSPVAR